MLNFGGTEAKTATDLIPDKTLAFVSTNFRELKNSKATDGRYYDVELTVLEGQYARKKIFEMVCDPSDLKNSEGWRNPAFNAFMRMLDFVPNLDRTQLVSNGDPENDRLLIEHIVKIVHDKRIAVKIKIEPGEDGYQDKNKVAEWLSPNPTSKGYKSYQALVSGATPAGPGPALPAGGFAPKAAPQAHATATAMGGFGGFQQPAGQGQPGHSMMTKSPSDAPAGVVSGTPPAWMAGERHQG